VIVTLEIETVGSVGALYVPIVRTLFPPRMMVALAPAPMMLTLTLTITPPAYVPRPIRIVLPARAAAIAALSVE
jgi:hypothetical protein